MEAAEEAAPGATEQESAHSDFRTPSEEPSTDEAESSPDDDGRGAAYVRFEAGGAQGSEEITEVSVEQLSLPGQSGVAPVLRIARDSMADFFAVNAATLSALKAAARTGDASRRAREALPLLRFALAEQNRAQPSSIFCSERRASQNSAGEECTSLRRIRSERRRLQRELHAAEARAGRRHAELSAEVEILRNCLVKMLHADLRESARSAAPRDIPAIVAQWRSQRRQRAAAVSTVAADTSRAADSSAGETCSPAADALISRGRRRQDLGRGGVRPASAGASPAQRPASAVSRAYTEGATAAAADRSHPGGPGYCVDESPTPPRGSPNRLSVVPPRPGSAPPRSGSPPLVYAGHVYEPYPVPRTAKLKRLDHTTQSQSVERLHDREVDRRRLRMMKRREYHSRTMAVHGAGTLSLEQEEELGDRLCRRQRELTEEKMLRLKDELMPSRPRSAVMTREQQKEANQRLYYQAESHRKATRSRLANEYLFSRLPKTRTISPDAVREMADRLCPAACPAK
eukprot:TRINITY_DN21384_c0_g1_i1.p1 TRINITY_DN21384_c0_g1~~TRINITY_DN21384_c0_g1_i1.p1  ORF type:complete len:516 (+),score=95.03 TRINITY_DN21384_c0_g1_i1:86-1633(+)